MTRGTNTVASTIVAALVACSPPNTPVQLGGVWLHPNSAIEFNEIAPGRGETLVIVADNADLCGAYATLDCCNSLCSIGLDPLANGTFLYLLLPGIDSKTYPAGPPPVRGTPLVNAEVVFAMVVNGWASQLELSQSGTVTLESIELNKHAFGRYHVTMKSLDPDIKRSEEIEGSFAGNYCAALNNLYTRVRSCTPNWSSTLCSTNCTCQNQRVESKCARPDTTSPWSCACLSPTGQWSNCTMPASSSGCGNGYVPSTSCCPMSF
jgi:hypothetical protein